jgi:hypothetical protein
MRAIHAQRFAEANLHHRQQSASGYVGLVQLNVFEDLRGRLVLLTGDLLFQFRQRLLLIELILTCAWLRVGG